MKKNILFVIALLAFVTTVSGQNYDKLSCGAEFSFVRTLDNKLLVWGANDEGQLGMGNNLTSTSPQEIPGSWIDVSAGSDYTLALAIDSTLWATGANNCNQLGINTSGISINTFQQVSSTLKFKSIAAGFTSTFAIKTDGTLWACGYNEYGQLGNGTTDTLYTLTQVSADTGWVQVSCGFLHAIALKSDGTLWSWGHNPYGQLGNGTQANIHTPIQIGIDKWVMVSAGANHSLALKTDGTLWSWGLNSNGELGRVTLPQLYSTVPEQVGTDDDWAKTTASVAWAFAIKNDGTLWGWGHNGYGQIGAGNIQQINIPQQVGTNNDWVTVEGSIGSPTMGMTILGTHSAGLRGACEEICTTGNNYISQLGNGISSMTYQDHFECGIASSVTSIEHEEAITIFPNPADNVLYIQNESKGVIQVIITDISGKVLLNSLFQHSVIDISQFNAGNYFLMLNNDEGQVFSGEFLKK